MVALASLPLVPERACRYRIVPPDELLRYRMSWAGVLALVPVDPEVATQRSDLALLQMALPEVNYAQPRGVYREVIVTPKALHPRFARDLGGLIAAPAEKELCRPDELRRPMATKVPVFVEDSEVGPGLCCACGKEECWASV